MTSADVSEFARAYERSRAYVESIGKRGPTDDVSGFWAQHFSDRPNFPSFNDMLVMRRGGFTYGVGEVTPADDEDAERAWAEATWHVARASAPDLDLAAWPESPVGAPRTFELGGQRHSGSAVINALTSHRIVTWCRRFGLERPLRVLEIGPGYGQGPLQLIGRIKISTYAVCDLPENLFLSSFYLQASQSELPVSFVAVDEVAERGVIFTTPPDLERLRGPFDLVVNAYSLQEMNLQSVLTYYRFIAANLAEDGFFYSLNSHGKAGVRVPSDYPTELFDVAHLGPMRRFPFQLFATEPYELVLRRGQGRRFWKDGFDSVGRLLQFGFQDELSAICDGLARESLGDGERSWLQGVAAALTGPKHDRRDGLEKMEQNDVSPAVTALLRAFVAFALGESALVEMPLQEALAGLSPSGARVRALVVLAAVTTDPEPLAEAKRHAPHLANELDRFASDPSALRSRIAEMLELPRPARAAARARLGRLRRSLSLG
jgi:putative sugar O-methyltransferase